jgi:hypothetical protein
MRMLGINTLAELAAADPREMYDRFCAITGQKVDICLYDQFCCAIAQSRNPRLPEAQKDWYWWSRQRLNRHSQGYTP